MNVVLVEPQIPPNTGNIARLCAATGVPLHLVGSLGFRLTDRYLKRAGLDYWDYVQLERHPSLRKYLAEISSADVFFFSKKGGESYVNADFHGGSSLVFGSETKGLPDWVFEEHEDRALDYLDQRHDVKFVSPKTAQTIPELRLLLTELTTQAFQIQQGIEIYREGDLSRVINVGELQKPSFKSISKNVDRLAKTIKRSANRL